MVGSSLNRPPRTRRTTLLKTRKPPRIAVWGVSAAIFLSSAVAHAEARPHQDIIQELSERRTWHSLLKYEASGGTESGFLSAIHSPEFFLHPEGARDPRKELEATLEAFQDAPGDQPDEHPACRFPARHLWLRQQLGDAAAMSGQRAACPSFDQWRQHGQIESISVIYATGFLSNPASFYGHILLKWNSQKTRLTSKLDDVSVNYGAIIPDDEDPVSYILKGLFGGYDAGFSSIKYYFHDHLYGDNELRDLWEYELNLTAGETEFLVAHSWEVLGKRYTYYFLRQNCAYHMADFFNIIGLDLIPDTRAWTIPQAVMQRIANAEHHGKPLLKKVIPHYSRQSILNNKFSQLTADELALIEEVANDIDALDGAGYRQSTPASKLRALETLIDYYQVVREKSEQPHDPLNLAYNRVLAERFSLPVGRASFNPAKARRPPHEGRNPGMTSVGISHNSRFGSALAVTYRPAYYDALDTDHGHIANASLSMADFAFYVDDDDGFSLKRLDVISIRKINPLATNLPGDDGFAWNLRAGWEQASFDCRRCATFRIQGDAGYSAGLAPNWQATAYIGGGAQDSRIAQGNLFVRTPVELQAELNKDWRMRLAYEWRLYDGGQTDHPFVWQMRYRLDTNIDTRLEYRQDETHELQWTLGYYW